MLLELGRVIEIDSATQVVNNYERKAVEVSRATDARMKHFKDKGYVGDGTEIRILSVECHDFSGRTRTAFEYEEPFEIRIGFELGERELAHPTFIIRLYKGAATSICCAMELDVEKVTMTNGNRGELRCKISHPRFAAGGYDIAVGVMKHKAQAMGQKHYVPPQVVGSFEISTGQFYARHPELSTIKALHLAPIAVKHDWEFVNAQP